MCYAMMALVVFLLPKFEIIFGIISEKKDN